MMHKTCSINYGHLANLQKTLPTNDLKKLSFDKISPHDFYLFFPFFSICTCLLLKWAKAFLFFFYLFKTRIKQYRKIIIQYDKSQKNNDLQYNFWQLRYYYPFVLYQTFTNNLYKRDKVLEREEKEKQRKRNSSISGLWHL